MKTKFSIQLNSGRWIHLEQISQHRTYAGWLEGKPNKSFNDGLIERCIKAARNNLWYNIEPVLIPPIESSVELYFELKKSGDSLNPNWIKIPDIAVLSAWSCDEPVESSENAGSVLKIVWFQDEFAFPIDDSILREIKDLKWEQYARDFEIHPFDAS